MNVLEIPFNKLLGLQKADNDSGFIYKLEEKKEYLNHLGTLHAGVLFVLAEATSGQFLIDEFKDYESVVIPVVRKAEVKYSKQGKGKVFSKADFINTDPEEVINDLRTKKRAIAKVKVDIYNENSDKLMTSVFEWFITIAK